MTHTITEILDAIIAEDGRYKAASDVEATKAEEAKREAIIGAHLRAVDELPLTEIEYRAIFDDAEVEVDAVKYPDQKGHWVKLTSKTVAGLRLCVFIGRYINDDGENDDIPIEVASTIHGRPEPLLYTTAWARRADLIALIAHIVEHMRIDERNRLDRELYETRMRSQS